jgi:hypothetical protein
MFEESSLITKILLTIGIAIYVVGFVTILYPVAVYDMLTEMIEHVWGLENNQLSASNK